MPRARRRAASRWREREATQVQYHEFLEGAWDWRLVLNHSEATAVAAETCCRPGTAVSGQRSGHK